MTALHTPLTTDEDGTITDARGHEILDLWVIDEHGRMRVNDANEAAMRERAAEIVLRCNLHDQLVDALRKAKTCMLSTEVRDVVNAALDKADGREAIAKRLAAAQAFMRDC